MFEKVLSYHKTIILRLQSIYYSKYLQTQSPFLALFSAISYFTHFANGHSQSSDSLEPYLAVCTPQLFKRILLSKLQRLFLFVFCIYKRCCFDVILLLSLVCVSFKRIVLK